MRSAAILTCVSALVVLTGCGTALKQAYYTVRGAKGGFYELQPVDSDTLVTYRSVQVERFSSELDDYVPADVLGEINDHILPTLLEADLFYPGGKTLLITGKIMHYTGESGLKGTISSVVGGADECVCRVQLRDADSREPIGEAMCWGEVKSALRREAKEYGRGVARGITKWLEERLPEEERERREEELRSGSF